VSGPVDLAAELASFPEHWLPKIIATFNGHDIMVVKVKGEFVWPSHPDTRDVCLVLSRHRGSPDGRQQG
jgi:hypothetical protein